ncbi:HlyD family secretion protein [Pendulispora brunnea]|uniref:HlyD family secretion protein n=1 Tax=Pendulispora brunnea TaxID=2905690 RepID=A0ABZ2KEA7_9BACT
MAGALRESAMANLDASEIDRTRPRLHEHDDREDEDARDGEVDKRPLPARIRAWVATHKGATAVILVVIATLVAGGVLLWRYLRTFESTDDAQIDGDITALSARVTGVVTAVHTTDNQHVNQGDLLVELDAADAKVALQEAEARVVRARAQNRIAQVDRGRSKTLVGSGSLAAEDLDQRTASAQVAAAELKAAEAALEQARLDLGYTRVFAAVSGIVGKKSVNVGDHVQPGQRLLAIVHSNDLWVTANFKETQLARMQPGQRARVSVDAFGVSYDAVVDSMPGASGPRFSLFPPENATGNYVKVVQRLPVRLRFVPGQPGLERLRPGMSVVPKVYLQ